MSALKDEVLAALAAVPSPDGTPLTATGKLSDILVTDGKVFFSLTVDAAHVHAELFHAKDAQRPRTADQQTPATPSEGAAEVTIILDGRRSTFRVDADGERILDAALRVRSDAPYACKGGVCGTCRARLVSGSVEMDQHFALEQREIDAGFVLACQSHPTTPTVVLDFDQ